MPRDADSLTEAETDDGAAAAGPSSDPTDNGVAADSDRRGAGEGPLGPDDQDVDDDWDEWDDDEYDEYDDWDDDDPRGPEGSWRGSAGPYPDAGAGPHPDAGASAYPDARRDGELFHDADPDDYDFQLAPSQGRAPGPDDMFVFDEPPSEAAYRPRRMSRAERRRRVRLQARRVRRIIRHIEPWSVLKISLFFYACLWLIFLIAGFMIWGVAESSGTVGKLEDLVTELFALDEFVLDAGQIFRGYALGGLALAIAGTTFNVLMCLLFNLISDLTGGLRITMIEEETARPAPPRRLKRRPPRRRPPARR